MVTDIVNSSPSFISLKVNICKFIVEISGFAGSLIGPKGHIGYEQIIYCRVNDNNKLHFQEKYVMNY